MQRDEVSLRCQLMFPLVPTESQIPLEEGTP
jgi:hypothetical protein